MENKKVSILIPIYNSEQYIEETIESALAQTYENIEIIIVDDGSKDNSLEIAKTFEKKYQNIQVFAQENKGASAARNKAFSMSTGEYIQYLDADDILDFKKIEMQMKSLLLHDSNAVAFAKVGNFEKNIGNVIFRDEGINKNYSNTLNYLIDSWSQLESAITVSWLTPRKLIDEVGGWNEKFSKNDDGEFFSRIVFHASQLIYQENSIAYYRVGNSSSLSSTTSEESERSRLLSYDAYMELIEDHLADPKIRKALAILYSAYIYSIYPVYPDLISEAEKRLHKLGFNKPIKNSKNICTPLYSLIGFYNAMRVCKFLKSFMQ